MRQLVVMGLLAALAGGSWGCQGRGAATAAPSSKRAEREPAAALVAAQSASALAPAANATAPPVAAEQPSAAPVAAPAPVPTPAAARAPAGKRHLRYGCRSADELMTKMLAALAAKDVSGMEDLRVTRQEHDELLWPEFDAKNHNVQPDFAWDMLNRRSHVGAGRAIGDHGGQELTLLEVEFTRGIEPYASFVLHRGTLVHTRTQQGEMLDLRFCGSVVELDGQFKLLSYKD